MRNHRAEYLRKEQKALLELADRVEAALELASHKDFPEHQRSLSELRALEHSLRGILEHCHSEDRAVESTIHAHANAKQRLRINEEHEKLVHAVAEFREELRFATVDRMMAIIVPGMNIVQQLRTHLAFEAELLDRVFKPEPAGRKGKAGKKARAAKRVSRRIRVPTAEFAGKEERPKLPYTMEPHPEL